MYARRRTMACAFMATVGLILLTSGYAEATTCRWNGPEGSYANWSSANWVSSEPGPGDEAIIGFAGLTMNAFVEITNTGEVCTNLWLGYNHPAASGTIHMSSGFLSVTASEYVGHQGTGAFTQTGGNHQISSDLYLGNIATSTGSYELSGTGALSVHDERIGNYTTGAFTQTGGSHIADILYLGVFSGSTGSYELSGTGALSTQAVYAGNAGTGAFTQTGGTHDVAGDLTLGQSATGHGAYTLDSAGSGGLTVDGDVCVGFNGTGAFVQDSGTHTINGTHLWIGSENGSDGSSYELNGGTLTVGVGASPDEETVVGRSAQANFTHTGGAHTVARIILGDSASGEGTYDLSGTGQVNADNEYVGSIGTGYFNHGGSAVNTISENLFVGCSNSTGSGRYTQTAGQLSADIEYIGHDSLGTFEQDGGANSARKVYLGYAGVWGGVYTHTGGTCDISDQLYLGYGTGSKGTYYLKGGLLTGSASLRMRYMSTTEATFQGYGVVGLTGSLINSGRIIADGYGIERTLDFSGMASVWNYIDNWTANGWFAQDRGKLLLPAIALAAGSNTYNWGEPESDPDIDLVNSVRMDFTNVASGGDLSISLLDPSRSDVLAGLINPIGVWYFDTAITFDEVDLTFRYDHALAAALGLDETDLRLYHHGGGGWANVTSGIDIINNWIYADAMTSFSYFAVATGADNPPEPVPEPLSVIFFGAGLAGVLGYLRRRRALRGERE